MYTKIEFGTELKQKVLRKEVISEIGHWAYSIYMAHVEDIDDDDFDKILLTLSAMEDGPEFEFTYERLDEISDDLISGNDVNLDY